MTKGPLAFRTISEASEELGVPAHVLRFWESRFSFIRPMKRAGGRRFYRPQDIAVLHGVRALLHEDGYTIKGVQKLHKEQGMGRLLAARGQGMPPEGHVPQAPEFLPDTPQALAPAPPMRAPPAPNLPSDRRLRLAAIHAELVELRIKLGQLLNVA